MRQKAAMAALSGDATGEARPKPRGGEVRTAAHGNGGSGNDEALLERIVERDNVEKALKRVVQNKGSPGIDGMRVEELRPWLFEYWGKVREQLLTGTYRPAPVREQEIPKSGGGTRKLGIPTVLDRLVQQCILQVLQPMIDPTFSNGSFGFRPGRGAHDAVRTAQRFIQEGKTWVVDVDLEKFFDRVNHDVLMSRLARRISDKRLLGLIRRFLTAGIMVDGVVMEREEGTPQGGPLSPLLANVLLDDVDKELERRGLAFVRYADDCNVYVRSRRAAEDAMETMRLLFSKLRLRINEAKSAVDRPWRRKFLGYSFWRRLGVLKLCVSPKALERLRERIRELTRRVVGRSLKATIAALKTYLIGWWGYFRLAQTPTVFAQLDTWIRRRLRVIQQRQWKRPRTAYRALIALGALDRDARTAAAAYRNRSWWTASKYTAHVLNPRFDALGLPRLKR